MSINGTASQAIIGSIHEGDQTTDEHVVRTRVAPPNARPFEYDGHNDRHLLGHYTRTAGPLQDEDRNGVRISSGLRISRGVRISGRTGVRISGYRGVRISGHRGVRISGHRGVRISSCSGVRISGREGVRISGSRGVRISSAGRHQLIGRSGREPSAHR